MIKNKNITFIPVKIVGSELFFSGIRLRENVFEESAQRNIMVAEGFKI